jgi:hypothetical protein
MRRLVATALLVLAVALVGAPAAQAKDTVCVGTIGGFVDNVVVPSGAECVIAGATVRGNVLAEPTSSLGVFGTGIAGNLKVKEGATLNTIAVTVGGNYACDKCVGSLFASRVAGNAEIKDVSNGTFVELSQIGGNLDVVGGSAGGSAFLIAFTSVGGNFKFEKNAGPTSLFRNTVEGNLSIKDNNVSGAVCPPPGPEGIERPCIENGEFFNNEVGGHMKVTKNVGPTDISLSVVGQKLECKENSPPPTGSGNVAGRKEGQCRAL